MHTQRHTRNLEPRVTMLRMLLASCLLLVSTAAFSAEPNTWVKIEGGALEGRRWDVPLGYSPESKRFLVLGGRTDSANYKKERPYDVLSITAERARSGATNCQSSAKSGAESLDR